MLLTMLTTLTLQFIIKGSFKGELMKGQHVDERPAFAYSVDMTYPVIRELLSI